MSNRYKGGIISATPPTTTGGEDGVASGTWTLEQQMQAQAAGLWPIQPPPLYIEDVFSTWLYTGNGATQTITNGINLSGKGGLVWTKNRANAYDHYLYDTARGVNKVLLSNNTIDQQSLANTLTAFNSNGFTLGGSDYGNILPGAAAVSWTFRKQEKFFDCVTYTGDGVAGRTVAHNLGSVPGCIIVKRTDASASWYVYHRGVDATRPQDYVLLLDQTLARIDSSAPWNDTAPTATDFTVGDNSNYNGSGATYVAYLFAHDAGGFGPTESENVISCGSFTPDALGNATVNLGYEPQWILYKGVSGAGGTDSWVILDTMRGWDLTTSDRRLFPNTSGAENTSSCGYPTATGFEVENLSASPYIYIAIRRGPMKTPTTGTSVFSPTTASAEPSSTPLLTGGGFPSDLVLHRPRMTSTTYGFYAADRLRGRNIYLETHNTAAEANSTSTFGVTYWQFDRSDAAYIAPSALFNNNGEGNIGYALYSLRRAPGFFDEVCYTGTSVAGQTFAHNLAVVPEMMIVKSRNSAYDWFVYHKDLTSPAFYLNLNTTAAESQYWEAWYSTAPTASLFTVGRYSGVGASGNNYVNYLFASAPGVSKVGSYTGTGTTQTIDCGFTAGSRFVLIKRTDSTGDWYVWDSARGIVAGDDPYLLLNSSAAEVTNTDYIDTTSVGFEISSTAPAAINASGGTFIFLAIA